MSGQEPTSISFAPRPIAPRRRRFDPLRMGIAAVAIGIVVAMVKPWDAADPVAPATTLPLPSRAAADETVASPLPARSSSASAARRDGGPPLAWGRIAPVLQAHDAWGARAIVRARRTEPSAAAGGGRGRDPVDLVERWSETRPIVGGLDRVRLQTADQGVLAIGVTAPRGELVIDVRVWAGVAGEWRWVDAQPIDALRVRGSLVLTPPTVDGVTLANWPTGSYRLDVLTSDAIRRFELHLPNRFDVVRDPGRAVAELAAVRPTGIVTPDPFGAVPAAIASIGDIIVPLGAPGSTPLDEEAAWRDREVVDALYLPGTTGLGVVLPVAAAHATASIRQLAPDVAIEAESLVEPRGDGADGPGPSPFVVFAAPDGAAWPAGVYAIDAAWSDGEGRHAVTFHLELRPGPVERTSDGVSSPDGAPARP